MKRTETPGPSFLDQQASSFANAIYSWPVVAAVGIFTVLLAMVYAAHPINDPDAWWHLKTGWWIDAHGAVPKTDPFSYLIQGKRWVAHEWLAQWIFWESWQAGGPFGLFLFREIWAGLLWGILFLWGAVFPLAASAMALFGFSIAGYGMMERPQLFSFLFILFYRWLLPCFISSSGRTRLLYAAVILLIHCAWANTHGGASIVGLVIMGSYAAALLLKKEERPQAAAMAALAFSAFLIGLANPNGVDLYLRLIGEFTQSVHGWITEMKPLTPGESRFWPYVLYLLLLAFSIWHLEPGAPRNTAAILGLGFGAVSSFLALRNVALGFFITYPDLMRGLTRFFQSRPRVYFWLSPVLFLFIIGGHRWAMKWSGVEIPDPNSMTQEWTKGACDFIQRERLEGRMYNDFVAGGHLIWRLSPERPVFIDGRSWEYGEELLKLLYFVSTREGFEAMDQRYQFDYAVFQARKDERLIYLDRHPDWVCVYFDDGSFVYVHRERQNKELARRLGYRWIVPNEPHFAYLNAFASEPEKAKGVTREIERSIRESPPEFTLNGYLMKSYWIQTKDGPQAWARWMSEHKNRFEHPAWIQQVDAAMRMLR